jgi:carbon-monoxide dehydrogenase small subunit
MLASEKSLQHKKHIAFTVNGKEVRADIDCRMTLAEFLREALGLTGTKVGCNRGECGSCTVLLDGRGECGSCTVLLDGKPVYSCTILAVEAGRRKILTIEGLRGEEGRLHPLQEAFVEEDALQCGFCTPGMILSVKALLDRNPRKMPCSVDSAHRV